MKVYLHMHNGNVQQNPLCVESFSISPRLSPTMFDPDANSALLRAHLCTAVDFMCRKACVRNCSRERKGLSTHAQRECSAEPSMRGILCHGFSISPRLSPTMFDPDANSVLSPVFMLTKSCTKILIFSTRFSCQHFALEDPYGKKSSRWGNVMFGHGFDKLV